MRRSTRIPRIRSKSGLAQLAACFCLIVAGFFFSRSKLVACWMTEYSPHWETFDPACRMSHDTPAHIREQLRVTLNDARLRVSKFWETSNLSRKTRILYCHDKGKLRHLSVSGSTVTYKTPFGCWVILGPDSLNTDIVSHELMHGELAGQLGFIRAVLQMPVWFDEGLALQVDYRESYGASAFARVRNERGFPVSLEQIDELHEFWSGNVYHHYLLAGHAVRKKLEAEGKSALLQSIEAWQAGTSPDFSGFSIQ